MKLKYIPVSEFGTVITGKTPSTSKTEYWDGNIPFITPTDIKGYDMFYINDTERYVSDEGLKTQKKTLLPKDAICISCIASIGKICLTKTPSITNQQINTILTNKNYDSRYLFYVFRNSLPYLQLIGGGTGSGTPIISKGRFEKLKYPVFTDIEYQKKVANILSKYDELIEVNNKRIKILEQTAEELYKEWFVRFRFPGHETAQFENGIPKGWSIHKVGDFCKVFTGKKDVNQTVENGKYKFFSCSPDVFFSNDYIYDGDAMIVAGNGSYTGRTRYYSGKFDLYQRTYAIVCENNKYLLKFLYWTFKVDFERKLLGGTRGAAIPYIVMGDITKYKFLYDKDLVNKYVSIVDEIYKELDILEIKNDNLIKQRDLLLPRLMSGKLEV